MDLTFEIDSENQQQIQLKLIHDTTKVSISKVYSQLMSADENPKATDQETRFSFTKVSIKYV